MSKGARNKLSTFVISASPSFLPYGIVEQEEYGSPCKDKLDQIDTGSIHYADRNYEHQDFSFETHQWKKRLSFSILNNISRIIQFNIMDLLCVCSASTISPLEINDTGAFSFLFFFFFFCVNVKCSLILLHVSCVGTTGNGHFINQIINIIWVQTSLIIWEVGKI